MRNCRPQSIPRFQSGLQNATPGDLKASRRGTTWTYITTDQPFGIAMQHALREFMKRHAGLHL